MLINAFNAQRFTHNKSHIVIHRLVKTVSQASVFTTIKSPLRNVDQSG